MAFAQCQVVCLDPFLLLSVGEAGLHSALLMLRLCVRSSQCVCGGKFAHQFN